MTGQERELSPMIPAIVRAKLERFDWEIQRRLEIGAPSNQLLDEAGIPRVQQHPDRTSVFAQYTVFVADRESVQAKLKAAWIPTTVHYPVPLNPATRLCTPVLSGLHANRECGGEACNEPADPMSADLTRVELDRVIRAPV